MNLKMIVHLFFSQFNLNMCGYELEVIHWRFYYHFSSIL